MPPDLTRTDWPGGLDAVINRVIRRLWIADAASALTIAAVGGAMVSAVLLPRGRGTAAVAGAAVALLLGAVALWMGREGRSGRAAAARIEQAQPEFHNVIITAEELRAHPDRARAWIRDRVMADAGARASDVRPAAVVRISRPLTLCAVALAVWGAVWLGLPRRAATAITNVADRVARTGTTSPAALRFVVELRPPAYTNVAARELVNPERLDVIAGTAMRLRLPAGQGTWRVRFGDAPLRLQQEGNGFVGDTLLGTSGYFAIEQAPAESSETSEGPRRTLLPVTVTPDRAPAIRIDAPGRDLLLPSSATRIEVSASALDDFALQSLELKYTRVSGSGEQFEFEEGTVPLDLVRESERAWKGRAALALGALKMAPGDALVYRAVGRDRRPGDAGLASSDTFFVEIQGPGQVALDGVEMPPDEERYALSQQMVVLKIERLRARERSMPRQAVEEASALIAAEQRAVRANFIFLMGGHVEDEFEEAEQSHEIQEGRLENSARKDISAAIHQMTLAEQGLTALSTAKALPPARAAVDALQRAFGRNRYILRTLASRSRVDPSRRLSGKLEAASDWQRDIAPAALDRTIREARALLGQTLDIAATLQAGGDVAPARLAALAEQALRIDPGSKEWQSASARLMEVRDAIAAKRPDVAARLNEALAPIVAITQKDARPPSGPASTPAGALRRAWAAESRK
jgi:hypothetical protein